MDPLSTPQKENFPTNGEKVFPDTEGKDVNDALSDPNSPLKQIRTFQGDMADAIRRQNESLISIQRAEQAKLAAERAARGEVVDDLEDTTHHDGRKVFTFFVLSLLLIGLGAVGGWFGYQEIARKMTPPEIPISPSRLITTTDTTEIYMGPLSRLELIDKVALASEEVPNPGQILHIDLVTASTTGKLVVPAEKFLEKLETNAPGSLVRAFDPIFMLGAFGGETKSIFLIMPVNSFENAFPGMLTWESTLAQDLGPLFATRNLLSNISSETKFQDLTIRNKDTRVLKDDQGNIILIYSFFDTKTLIITDNEESLRTLISRLENELLSR